MPADPILAAAAGNLSPDAPGLTTGASGGDLGPAAPAALVPAAGGGSSISSITVSGELTDGSGPIAFPEMFEDQGGLLYGKPAYQGDAAEEQSSQCSWSGTQWILIWGILEVAWYSSDDVPTPDLVTTWTPGGGATGTPIVTLNSGTSAETPEMIVPPNPLPSTPGQLASAIASNLSPAAPAKAKANAGGDLVPAAPPPLASDAAGNLAPDAPAQKVAENPLPTTPSQSAGTITANLSPAAPGAITP